MKLIVFDLDGTLAPVGGPIGEETISAMRELERRGIRIALCSGKPVYYLCGMLRQAGLKTPVLLGENGGTMQVGIDLPPAEHYILPYSRAAEDSLRLIREKLTRELPRLWYQPNQVGLTPFFHTEAEKTAIGRCLEQCAPLVSDIDIYPQTNCYDIMPRGVSKAAGIRALGEYLGVDPADMAAVGDGINDYPMFAFAGLSIGIGLEDPGRVDVNLPDIGSAVSYLLDITKEAAPC